VLQMRSIKFFIAVIGVLLVCSGCSSRRDGSPEVAKVTGSVTLDGTPVTDAIVRFETIASGLQANGMTDDEGTFRMMYKRGIPGAPVGEHYVTISSGEGEKVPAIYSEREKSGLTAVVTAKGPNHFQFDLKASASP